MGVGTAHGVYKGTPHIEQNVLKAIRARVDIPLVLHGTSGVPDDQVRMAVQAGVRKMNFATDLVYAFLNAVYAKAPEIRAMDVFMQEPIEAMKQYAVGKIRLLGADMIL